MPQPNDFTQQAIVIDASVAVAIVSKEANASVVLQEIAVRTNEGAAFYAPAVIVSEVLYVLCRKVESGLLAAVDHPKAVQDFEAFIKAINPPPSGDFSLTLRSDAIRAGYSCRRVSDSLYIALAEELSRTCPTVLLTLDHELSKQAARRAAGFTVQTL